MKNSLLVIILLTVGAQAQWKRAVVKDEMKDANTFFLTVTASVEGHTSPAVMNIFCDASPTRKDIVSLDPMDKLFGSVAFDIYLPMPIEDSEDGFLVRSDDEPAEQWPFMLDKRRHSLMNINGERIIKQHLLGTDIFRLQVIEISGRVRILRFRVAGLDKAIAGHCGF